MRLRQKLRSDRAKGNLAGNLCNQVSFHVEIQQIGKGKIMRLVVLFVFLCASFVCGAEAVCDVDSGFVGTQTHRFSVHDMLAVERISDPQVSPDGEWIVFVVRKTDLDENRGRKDLWLVRIDGTELRRLTSHPSDDTNPRWAPDGKSVWFISDRTESSQVWRIRIDELFLEDFAMFVDARESIAHRYGLSAYADVMSCFAAGERYLNRVWSASADGYIDEVNAYLDRALEQFTDSHQKVRQLKTNTLPPV
jgi:hypothetical protein